MCVCSVGAEPAAFAPHLRCVRVCPGLLLLRALHGVGGGLRQQAVLPAARSHSGRGCSAAAAQRGRVLLPVRCVWTRWSSMLVSLGVKASCAAAPQLLKQPTARG